MKYFINLFKINGKIIAKLKGGTIVVNIKENIDLIGKKIDIIKSKSLGFFAMAGGSFVYAVREDISTLLNVGIWMVFALSVYGIIINLQKFTNLYIQLERIENDTI